MAYFLRVADNFNPGLFNPKFQSHAKRSFSTPDFLTNHLSTPDISIMNIPTIFNLELFFTPEELYIQDFSTPDFSTPDVSTINFSTHTALFLQVRFTGK